VKKIGKKAIMKRKEKPVSIRIPARQAAHILRNQIENTRKSRRKVIKGIEGTKVDSIRNFQYYIILGCFLIKFRKYI